MTQYTFSRLFGKFLIPILVLCCIATTYMVVRFGEPFSVGTGITILIAASLSCLVVVGIVCYFLTRQINEFLALLNRTNERIQRGDYSFPSVLREHAPPWQSIAPSLSESLISISNREDQLHESITALNNVLGEMAEGVVAVDAEQRVIYANQAVKEMLSISMQDIAGRHFLEITRIPAIQEAVTAVFQTKQSVEAEFETALDAKILFFRCSWNSAEYNEGALLVFSDVTKVRTLEQMRRDFAANVSHELKTPLAAIKGYTETLQMGAIDDIENRDVFLSRIEFQAERLHTLILDLIELARIESGKASYEITEIDIIKVAEQCVNDFKAVVQSRRIEINLVFFKTPILVSADAEAIRMILDNLLSNAIRYSHDEGSITVTCRTDGDQAVIDVTDTGLGIAPEYHERIFERFYRIDKARSTDAGGTGLGLSIVKHLAQSFGGGVSVTSKIGIGSTFSVHLPAVKL